VAHNKAKARTAHSAGKTREMVEMKNPEVKIAQSLAAAAPGAPKGGEPAAGRAPNVNPPAPGEAAAGAATAAAAPGGRGALVDAA